MSDAGRAQERRELEGPERSPQGGDGLLGRRRDRAGGDVGPLRWQDVDLRGKLITVRGSLQRGTREIAPTKTSQSCRVVALDPETASMLAAHRHAQVCAVDRDADFGFRTAAGMPLHARHGLRDLHLALKAAGLPRMPFHQLRHGYATLMLEAGIDIAVVSKALGHSTITTTVDTYMHVTPAAKQVAVDRMGAILHGGNDRDGVDPRRREGVSEEGSNPNRTPPDRSRGCSSCSECWLAWPVARASATAPWVDTQALTC